MSLGPLWGPVSSTIDWCEANYKHSSIIAEPLNTFSNLSIIIFGIVGALHELSLTDSIEKQSSFTILYATIAFIGLGSFLFHGKLITY